MSAGGLGCALGVSADGCVRVDTITSESARVRFTVAMAVISGFEWALFVLVGTLPPQLLPRSSTYHAKMIIETELALILCLTCDSYCNNLETRE